MQASLHSSRALNDARVIQPGCAGFSLLEVLVAFAILAMSLAVILQIFSTGLRAGALSDDYSYATSLAESKLTEISAAEFLEEADEVGEFDERFRWRTTIQLLPGWEEEENQLLPLRPYQVTVEVFWAEANRERSVSLATLRLAAPT